MCNVKQTKFIFNSSWQFSKIEQLSVTQKQLSVDRVTIIKNTKKSKKIIHLQNWLQL